MHTHTAMTVDGPAPVENSYIRGALSARSVAGSNGQAAGMVVVALLAAITINLAKYGALQSLLMGV